MLLAGLEVLLCVLAIICNNPSQRFSEAKYGLYFAPISIVPGYLHEKKRHSSEIWQLLVY